MFKNINEGEFRDVAERYDRSIRERLHLARLAINAALAEDEIRSALNSLGYDESTLRSGLDLLESAERIVRDHARRYGSSPASLAHYYEARESADRAYTRALTLGRIAFKDDPEAERSLYLAGRRRWEFAEWQGTLCDFFETLLNHPHWLSRMERFRYDAGRAGKDLERVRRTVQLHDEFMNDPGPEGEHARLREARLEEFHEWMSDFRDIAYIALEENPIMLERLGFRW